MHLGFLSKHSFVDLQAETRDFFFSSSSESKGKVIKGTIREKYHFQMGFARKKKYATAWKEKGPFASYVNILLSFQG